MITDPIENPGSWRWSRPMGHIRVLRGTATTTSTVAPGFRKDQAARRSALSESNVSGCTALRLSLTLPCNSAGSAVE